MKYKEIVRTFNLFDKKIFKRKGELSNRIINLKGGETHGDRIQQIIKKKGYKGYIFPYLFIYLFICIFCLFKVYFFYAPHDRMLHLVCVRF